MASYSKHLTHTPHTYASADALHSSEEFGPSLRQMKVSVGLIRLHQANANCCSEMPALLRLVT